MPGNTFGQFFRLTTFGESHGAAIGGIIDGCPAGLEIDFEFIQKELDRRRPGQSEIVSQRKESDKVEFLSGIFEGKTTATPIGFIIRNEDAKPEHYEHLKDLFRPSHADYTYQKKYGIRDYRGGGRASARETVSRVVGGAVAQLLLKKHGIEVVAYTSQVGDIELDQCYKELDFESIDKNEIRCPDEAVAKRMIARIKEVRSEGDTIGGVVTGIALGVPAGLGEPVFDKLQADLAKAMLSINAAKGFDYGWGFRGIAMKGSEMNDEFYNDEGNISLKTNYSGGIQGGISNAEDIWFRVLFKPVSTIMKKQKTVNTKGEEVEFEGGGRHDPCVLPRAVPVVEAMTALVLADHMLRNKIYE